MSLTNKAFSTKAIQSSYTDHKLCIFSKVATHSSFPAMEINFKTSEPVSSLHITSCKRGNSLHRSLGTMHILYPLPHRHIVSNVTTAQHYTHMQACPLGSHLDAWLQAGLVLITISCCREAPCLTPS